MVQISFVFLCFVSCLYNVSAINAYDNRFLRNTRPKNSYSQRIPVSESYSASSKRPVFYEGGNQWKPLLDIPTRPLPKYRKINSRPYEKFPKSQNIIYPPEYSSKNSHEEQYASTDFIANQSLLVSDDTTNLKPSSQKPKPKSRHPTLKSQYEVVEYINDDIPDHQATQNRYRYQETPTKTRKTSAKYSQSKPEKHYQYSQPEIIDNPIKSPVKYSQPEEDSYYQYGQSETHDSPIKIVKSSGKHAQTESDNIYQYSQPDIKEMHYHHVHYHEPTNEYRQNGRVHSRKISSKIRRPAY